MKLTKKRLRKIVKQAEALGHLCEDMGDAHAWADLARVAERVLQRLEMPLVKTVDGRKVRMVTRDSLG